MVSADSGSLFISTCRQAIEKGKHVLQSKQNLYSNAKKQVSLLFCTVCSSVLGYKTHV